MRRKQRPTQEVLDEALAETLPFDAQPDQAGPPDSSDKMSKLKFIGLVAGEIVGHLP